MASITTSKGKRRIQFILDGVRKSIRLGKVVKTDLQAEKIKEHVEHLINAKTNGQPLNADETRWLDQCDGLLRKRLVAVGLAADRVKHCLKDFIEGYISQQTDLKPASIIKLEQTQAKLLAYFDPTMSIRSINARAASNWREFLAKQELSEATVRQHCRNAKILFNAAMEQKIIDENHFSHLKSRSIAAENNRYVNPEETEKLLEQCPNLRWQIAHRTRPPGGPAHALRDAFTDLGRCRLGAGAVERQKPENRAAQGARDADGANMPTTDEASR